LCYCSYTQATELITAVFLLDIPFICWFRVFRVLCCVLSEVFTLEEVDGVGDSGSGYCTMVEV